MDRRYVVLSNRDIALILRDLTGKYAREYWVFCYLGTDEQIDEIRNTFYARVDPYSWIDVGIECGEYFETVRGTKRRVEGIRCALALREHMPAARILDWLLPRAHGGKAAGKGELGKWTDDPATPTAEQMEQYPQIWLLSGREWSSAGALAIREFFDRWVGEQSGFPERKLSEERSEECRIATFNAVEEMRKALKRALRTGGE